MVEFYCDEVFGGWEGCVPHVVIQKASCSGRTSGSPVLYLNDPMVSNEVM